MYRKFLKRFFDITLSFTALVILSPLLLLTGLALLLTGEHEVLYFQERIGYRNKPFRTWKFVTMRKNSEKMAGGMHTTRSDHRVLPLGNILRKTKLNELPQLVNILKGDMSIVGPRPLVYSTFVPYPDHLKERIYNIRPGLTGIGSIIFRDEEKLLSETEMEPKVFYAGYISPYKGEPELWYQQNLTFHTDFMLIFLTAWVIFFPTSELVYKIFTDLPARPDYLD
ncbi:MAG: sugar transferase [Bacteroidales bacterium]|nr:sugar transferase [Bacteroidales bacterium]